VGYLYTIRIYHNFTAEFVSEKILKIG